ncbi:MAG: hypothetical protein EXR79_00990 [Myxococcales bacterium]|nr:hypothetical protein [Myxococcales bacterium]
MSELSRLDAHAIQGRRAETVRVDPALFDPARGERCRIDECHAACCSNGIWVDVHQAQRILAHAADVIPLLQPGCTDPDQWFGDETWEHPDFPAGVGIPTALIDRPELANAPRCVLLMADWRCALQVASERLGLGWPGLKPFDCATFPLLRSEGELQWDAESVGELGGADCQRPTAGRPAPRHEVFRIEVELSLGRHGADALAALAGPSTADTLP